MKRRRVLVILVVAVLCLSLVPAVAAGDPEPCPRPPSCEDTDYTVEELRAAGCSISWASPQAAEWYSQLDDGWYGNRPFVECQTYCPERPYGVWRYASVCTRDYISYAKCPVGGGYPEYIRGIDICSYTPNHYVRIYPGYMFECSDRPTGPIFLRGYGWFGGSLPAVATEGFWVTVFGEIHEILPGRDDVGCPGVGLNLSDFGATDASQVTWGPRGSFSFLVYLDGTGLGGTHQLLYWDPDLVTWRPLIDTVTGGSVVFRGPDLVGGFLDLGVVYLRNQG